MRCKVQQILKQNYAHLINQAIFINDIKFCALGKKALYTICGGCDIKIICEETLIKVHGIVIWIIHV